MPDLKQKYLDTQLDLITTVAGNLSREDIEFALDEHLRASRAYIASLEAIGAPTVKLVSGTARGGA